MKYLKTNPLYVDCVYPAPLEKIMKEKMLNNKENISDKFTFINLSNACIMTNFGDSGMKYFQEQVDLHTEKRNKNLIFITHSINYYIDNIETYGNLFFSVHASENNNHISIPHTIINVGERVNYHKKTKLFSFQGAPTHKVRETLIKMFPKHCVSSMFFNNVRFVHIYKKMLTESIFSLCPRGTGVSSIRLWESMASGTIPVIISDGYKLPLENAIDWSSFSVIIKEKDVEKIPQILVSVPEQRRIEMMKSVINIYDEYFNYENLQKTIMINLNELE